jgi:hypothetical protein
MKIARWLLLPGLCAVGCASVSNRSGRTDEIPDSKPVIRREPATQPQRGDGPSGNNVRANQDASGFDQNETTLVINPANPQWILGGANDARLGRWTAAWYHSKDGGLTWTDGAAPHQQYSTQADPTAAYCGDGTAVFAYLDYTGAFAPHRFVATNSTNGGQTWAAPGVIASSSGSPFADRPYITCGPATGTNANRAYASWTNFPNAFTAGTIRIAYSDNRGATWTGHKNVSTAGAQGSMPAVGKNGSLYVFWQNGGSIQFNRSTNGGGSFAGAATIASYVGLSEPNFRRPTYPSGAVDTSSGPNDGYVYVVWHSATHGDADVFLARSTNGGTSWSAPIRVNNDAVGNGRDQFMPWVAVDEKGTVAVKFFDRRHDPLNQRQHLFIATSNDGGQTFVNERVSDVDSNSTLTGFLGDYSAISARGGRAIPLWSDLRAGTGEEDVYVDMYKVYPYDPVTNVRFTNPTTLTFDDQEPRTGTAIVYDIVRGFVSDLPSSSRANLSSCERENLAAPPATISGTPPSGSAWYYIARAQGTRGDGSFSTGSTRPDARESFDGTVVCGGP